MLPHPTLLYTSIIPVSELELLENEIAANNMMLAGALPASNLTALKPYAYNRGLELSGVGQFNGSPYGSQTPTDSRFSGIFWHCFPNERIFNQYKSNSTLPCFIRGYEWGTYNEYPSITRNGLTSIAYFKNYAGLRFDLFVYYDMDTGFVMEYNPHLKSEPKRRY